MKLFLLTFALLISLASCSKTEQVGIPGTTMPETDIIYTDSAADTDTDSVSEAASAESAGAITTAAEAEVQQGKQYTAVFEEQDNARIPQIVCIKHTDTGMRTELPSLEIYNRLLGESPRTSPFLSIDFTACDWLDTERLKVDFTIKTGVSYYPRTTTGWYIWDVSSGALTECIYESVSDAEDVPELSQSDIAEMIDKNLDILMTDSEGLYSEAEFISAHPEAFGEIVALGEAALPYLDHIISTSPTQTHHFSNGITRAMAAQIAAYAIKPALYDLIVPSPNDEYLLRLGVQSFLSPEWGGMMTTAYHQFDIISRANNSITSAFDVSQQYYGVYTHAEAKWSPDSHYIAVQYRDNKSYYVSDIFDVNNGSFMILPPITDILLPEDLQSLNISDQHDLDYIEYKLDSWLDNNIAVIDFYFRMGHFWGVTGDYTYDLSTHTMISAAPYQLHRYD